MQGVGRREWRALSKDCNTAVADWVVSLRASQKAVIRCVAYIDVGKGREQDAEALRPLEAEWLLRRECALRLTAF